MVPITVPARTPSGSSPRTVVVDRELHATLVLARDVVTAPGLVP
jgi:hypothetical protein